MMTLDHIIAALQTLEAQPSFFDHAYSELSHESFLAYTLDALRREGLHLSADPLAARFGETLLQRCLAIDRHDIHSLEVFRQRALGPNGKDRIDLMVHVQTPSGKSLWTIIVTKLHAPGDTSQLERYQEAMEKFCPFLTAHGQLVSVVLYKTGDFYNEVTAPDVILILRQHVLAMLEAVRATSPTDSPFDPVAQYARWIRKQCLRDTLIQHPAFQRWFYARDMASLHTHVFQEWLARQGEPGICRAIQWEVMQRLASSISTALPCKVRKHLRSDWNHRRGDDSAWTNFSLLTWEHEEDCAFYRLDAGWFSFRIYAGPPQGMCSEEKAAWMHLKHEVLQSLRQELAVIQLPINVQLARIDYPFKAGAKETSMCRVSLEVEGLDNVIAAFPALHHAIVRAMQAGSQNNRQWTLLSLFTEIPDVCPETGQAYEDRD